MTISVDEVKRLLRHDDPEAQLVLIEGRTEIVTPREADSPQYHGALQVISRDDLIKRTGGAEVSDHDLAEQAALLDSTIAELGG